MGKKRKRPAKDATGSASAAKRARHDTVNHPVLSRYYKRLLPLRQYVLEQLPASSKARRRRIATLGRDTGANMDPEARQLAHLLDSTLVGVVEEPDRAVTEARQREFLQFTQSPERSLLGSDRGGAKGATILQSDARPSPIPIPNWPSDSFRSSILSLKLSSSAHRRTDLRNNSRNTSWLMALNVLYGGSPRWIQWRTIFRGSRPSSRIPR